MSRIRLYRFTCDSCGKEEEFKSLYLPRLVGWIHIKHGFDVEDYCSDSCADRRTHAS